MKLWKYSGIFLIATGILHSIVASILGKETFLDIIRDGVIIGCAVEPGSGFWLFLPQALIIILANRKS